MAIVLAALGATPARAQHFGLRADGVQDELVGYYLPKIAASADGSYGIAAEALFRTSTGREVLRIVARRFSAAGHAVGPTHVFAGESCSSLDMWQDDYMQRPEVAFNPGGLMLILMQHSGTFVLATDGVPSTEITIGAIDASGQLLDLAPQHSGCVQSKLHFSMSSSVARPRFDLAPGGEIFLTADGYFRSAGMRNVAIRVFHADGSVAIDEVTPHEDTDSRQSFHAYPDIATNGSVILSTWHRCGNFDDQGNATECDVEVQFATITQQGLQALGGGNQRVNNGDAAGTLNIFPSAAVGVTGQSIVVWGDTRDGAHGEIYGQRFSATGQPVGTNFRVSAGQGVIETRPEVAMLQNGRSMVVWTDSSAVGYRARGRTYDAAGNPEGDAYELAQGIQSGQVSVAADGHDFAHIYIMAQEGTTAIGSNRLSGTAAEESPGSSAGLAITAAYPHPFAEEAWITYDLAAPSDVSIRVYDVLGRDVYDQINPMQPSGRHHVRLDGTLLAPGLYVVEMRAGTHRRTVSLVRRP